MCLYRNLQAGYFQEEGKHRSGSCDQYLPGRYQDSEKGSECKMCPDGQSHAVEASASISDCKTCPEGKHSTGGDPCEKCPKGKIQTSEHDNCMTCPMARYFSGNDINKSHTVLTKSSGLLELPSVCFSCEGFSLCLCVCVSVCLSDCVRTTSC